MVFPVVMYGCESWTIKKGAAAAKSLQSCPTLCNPIDGSPQVPPSLGFSKQEHWSGLPFPSPMHESEKWKWSRVWLLATPWIAAHQAPLSMEFYRQEYWSGVPSPSPILYIVASIYWSKLLIYLSPLSPLITISLFSMSVRITKIILHTHNSISISSIQQALNKHLESGTV